MVGERDLQPQELQVLLAEYALLREARTTAHDGSSRRFNFHLLVLSACGALFAALFGGEGQPSDLRKTLAVSVAFGALLLGLATYRRLLAFAITTTIYTRGLNLVRARLAVAVPDHLHPRVFALPLSDSVPGFYGAHPGTKRWALLFTLAGLVAWINAFIVAALAGLGAWDVTSNPTAALTAGLVVLSTAVGLQWFFQLRTCAAAERSWRAEHSD